MIAGVRSPPLRGAIQTRMVLRGKPSNNAKGGFVGETRSPRPDCEASRGPRHGIIIEMVRERPLA
jgi:hypothetical protein